MNIRTEFPHTIRHIENTWIPLPDGTRLAARIWMPEDAEKHPVPALLEYIPYRKRDDERGKAASIHSYFAGYGYASMRVDIRGSGESEGVLPDEYLAQEQEDALSILRWIAGQKWCSGTVGIFGISWGGFNALQIAALRPPELGAIITVCSTDDRYADDIHHMGGCLLGDNLSWASTMFDYNSLPPDPQLVGDRWREMWHRRLNESGLWLEKWLNHQRRDEYWKHGSVCEDYSAIQVPVYAISGWADGYTNSVFRLLANLEGPRKGLVGPWSHKYPHLGEPGPAIGFLQEALRWWDRWLKGRDTGMDSEPMLRVWMQNSVPPTTRYSYRPGRWVAEREWTAEEGENRIYALDRGGRLLKVATQADRTGSNKGVALRLQSPLALGLYAGKWCSYAAGPDLAYDQRAEDGGALVFDTEVLDSDFEILGAPRAELEVSVDRPVAMIAARLSDVDSTDRAARITYGLLNLTHRNSSESPEPLEPGRRYRVSVTMNHIAQHFPAGNRLRLSLSTSYWPLAWPPPEPVTMTVYPANSCLVLPVRTPQADDEELAPFAEAEAAPEGSTTLIEPERHDWIVRRNLATDESTLEVNNDHGTYHLDEIDLTMQTRALELYSCWGNDFTSIRGDTFWQRTLSRGAWKVQTKTRTVLTSTKDHFRVSAELDAYEGEERVFCKSWSVEIPRDLV